MDLSDLNDGARREISEEVFYEYLNLPSSAIASFTWNGEWWLFWIPAGDGYVCAFKKEDGQYAAQKTGLLDPARCGQSLADQQRPPAEPGRPSADGSGT